MKAFKAFLAIFFVSIFLVSLEARAQVPGTTPDAAFDTVNNRYLVVFEQDAGSGATDIYGKFYNADGTEAAGSPVKISVSRPTQGCFYGQFDDQNGEITTPTECNQNKNPAVAYNGGQFIIVWEVKGTAASPSSNPDNQFVNIFAQIVDATSLAPRPGWEEGIIISKIFIAANNAESTCGDKHACNDGQIQAWSQSINPDVAPRAGGNGFVVTWQTNKDFIGCADAGRRQAWSVYGRYVDQSFSATSSSNPPMFAVYQDDSTMADKCEPQSNVDNGSNPRIAFNEMSGDFVVAYEVARASGGNASIGAKRVTLNGENIGQVTGSIMPDIVASVSGSSLSNPDIISFKNNYYLFVGDGSNVRAKSFSSSTIANSSPDVIDLGAGAKQNPRVASNFGIGGKPATGFSDPERIVISYEQGDTVRSALLSEALAVVRAPTNASSGSAHNRSVNAASNSHDFLLAWTGESSGDKIFTRFLDSSEVVTNNPPAAPGLLLPADMAVTDHFAPTRAFLSWSPSTDPDGDTVTYNLYFGENSIPLTPQDTGIAGTEYIISPETFADTGVTLQSNKVYKWKIEADDGHGGKTSSTIRTFNTDGSVAAWWRFDEDPSGPVCTGGSAGETVCDTSVNANHAIPNGGLTWLPPPTVGVLGGALQLDGADDYLAVTNAASLNPNSMSLIYKFKNSGAVGEQNLIDKRQGGGSGPAGYDLRMQGTVYPLDIVWIITESNGVSHFLSIPGVINNAIDYQTISTFDSTTGQTKMFINGVNSGNQNFGIIDRSIKSSVNLFIGDSSVFAAPSSINYQGQIDEVILINKVINTDEVTNNYQSIN